MAKDITEGVAKALPEAFERMKRRRGITDEPARETAPHRNRYGQETYYPEALYRGPIKSEIPPTRPGMEACGNVRSNGQEARCMGCGKPEGLCLVCLYHMIHRRQRDMRGEGAFPRYAMNLERRENWQAKIRHRHVFRASKPIVMEHADSRPIECETEYQVERELSRIGLRSVRGPGQDA